MNYRNRTDLDALDDFEENPSMLIVNPSRRRRRHKKRARSRTRRKMTALQRKYFGGGRKKRGKRRARTITLAANPARRRRRSRSRSSYRRNPINRGAIRASVGSVTGALKDAATGAVGAIVVDVAMAQAGRFLPATLTMRYGADGSANWGYHGTKAALAIALGVLGARFLPGRAKSLAARAAVGSLTVQAYEIGKGLLPAELTLGYYNPARVANMAGMRGRVGYYPRGNARAMGRIGRVGRVGASYPAGSAFSLDVPSGRVGEGAIE